MITNINTFIGLILSTLLVTLLFRFISKQKAQNNLKKPFTFLLFCLLIWCIGLVAQVTLSKKLNIQPIYFDYFVYIGICFTPIAFLILTINFLKPSAILNIKKICLLLSIIPTLCLITLWTNDFHHLFYSKYSIILSQGKYGPFFYITTLYTYFLFGISLLYLVKHSIKNIKFYFLQSIFIFLGALVPVIVNLFGLIGIFDLSIYTTPMCFSITILCFALSIFRFGFLKLTPIALKNIVNRISDSYIVLNTDCIIIDFNIPLLKTFKIHSNSIINNNLFDIKDTFSDFNNISNKIKLAINDTNFTNSTVVLDEYFKKIDKHFHIEITRITEGNNLLGSLILLKDITQHKLDLETIKNNQERLIERERLATLGQMMGGIAHNLKTPIMSISGANEGLSNLVNEYKASVGDSGVTIDDHKEIARDMEKWIQKIQIHLTYMSDVITTVRGQSVAFVDNKSVISFTINDLIRQINILMKHELNHALVSLEESLQLSGDTVVNGNINSLVQVINNIISNAIQAYNGKTGEKIILDIYKETSYLILKIQDFAGGIPDTVKSKLFKEMTTTKGKDGTGLGLFMSYSNIKAHFNGNIRFETEKGKGTCFFIEIPL